MERKRTPQTQGDRRIEAYIDGLIEAGSQQRLPELFAGRQPNALYHIPDRHGVATIALRTPDLGEQQLVALLKYRLAQYLSVNMVDARMIYETGDEHEPRSSVSPDDVHLIAGSAESGEILCYAVFRALTGVPPGATLREQERPLFPVEQEFGWGIYNRLRILPDLPIIRVRELGRFMKNQRLHTLGPLGLRGPVEVGAAAMQLLLGPLRAEVEAVVGEIEEDVAGRNLAFFHAPIVVIHGAVPYVPEDAYLFAMYNYAARYPFALLSSDLPAARPRLATIEGALDLPGRQGLAALLALKGAGSPPGSSLEPPGGLAPLTTAEVPQRGIPMELRRQMRVVGERLRRTDLFRDLSDAEATVLGTFMERREVEEGEVIIRQGESGDDLFLIEAGRAEVRIRPSAGESLTLATFGPGDYFGEIALVTGSRRIADVVAVTPMRLMQLTREAYTRYLAQVTEVKYQVAQTAARRIGDTMQKLGEAHE